LGTHIAGRVTTLATCWKIVREDETVLGFTDHDRNLTYDGVVYKANTGYDRTNLVQNIDLGVNNQEITSILDSAAITANDIRAQKYVNAAIYVFTVNWADLTMGIIKLQRGWIGEIRMEDDKYIADLRGLASALDQNILRLISPECDADFGDTRCGYDLTLVKQSGAIDVAVNQKTFTTTGIIYSAANVFDEGKVTFTSGANLGVTYEIKTSTVDGTVSLYTLAPFTIANGDTIDIWKGCDKREVTCKAYSNYVNFRGCPDVIGRDALYEYPDAKA